MTIEANIDATVLLVSYGAFMMSTQEKVSLAIVDFNSGTFGRMQ